MEAPDGECAQLLAVGLNDAEPERVARSGTASTAAAVVASARVTAARNWGRCLGGCAVLVAMICAVGHRSAVDARQGQRYFPGAPLQLKAEGRAPQQHEPRQRGTPRQKEHPKPVLHCHAEIGVDYPVSAGEWQQQVSDVSTPDLCCERCNKSPHCRSWTWGVTGHGPKICWLKGMSPKIKVHKLKFLSGLRSAAAPPARAPPAAETKPPAAKRAAAAKPAAATKPAQAGSCGPIQHGIDYIVGHDHWFRQRAHVASPGACCAQCRAADPCKSWTWVRKSRQCILKGGEPSKKLPNYGVVSGLAKLVPIPRPRPAPRPSPPPDPHKVVGAGEQTVCGPLDRGKLYRGNSTWNEHLDHIKDPHTCREKCRHIAACRVWTWVKDAGLIGPDGPSRCLLMGGTPEHRVEKAGAVSGECRHTAHVGNASSRGVHGNRLRKGHPGQKADLRAPPTSEGWHPSCATGKLPELPEPGHGGPALDVKVLTYNLYWWNLFDIENDLGGKPFRLISGSMDPPYDVMGFQECEDPHYVLRKAGLEDHYHAIKGEMAICMAFRRDRWSMLTSGQLNVAEDRKDQYFGQRAAQFIRLHHTATGRTVFFMNHHGPLPVDSGGRCGGAATAFNIMEFIARNARPKDAIILVGDFNADGKSATVQQLKRRLEELFRGSVDGGIDHVFGNLPVSSVVKAVNLGNGGSDHDALQVVVRVGGGSPEGNGKAKKGEASQAANDSERTHKQDAASAGHAHHGTPPKALGCACDMAEHDIDYVIQSNWGFHFDHVPSPDVCCHRCSVVPECRSWIWVPAAGLNQCWLKGGLPVGRIRMLGHVSGLPNLAATATMHEDADKIRKYVQRKTAVRRDTATPTPGTWEKLPSPGMGNPLFFLSRESSDRAATAEARPPTAA